MLEQEIQIGNVLLRNRLVMAPVDFELSDLGTVSDKELAYYDTRTTSGNIGLVVAEHAYVLPDGRAVTNQLSIAKDADVPGLTKLVTLVHGHKTPIFLQLSHGGARIMNSNVSVEGISPSGLPTPVPGSGKGEPIRTHAMSLEEIAGLKEAFVQAALRARAAGADGIELHMAHGYLLDQFYSPLTNHRTDPYGGPVENRVRLVTELLPLLRENVGDKMVLGVRLGACDYLPGGNTLADGAKAAALLEQAGAQYISVSGGLCGARHPQNTGVGFFKDAAEAIQQVVRVPVLLTGGVKTRADAESLLAAEAADMVGVARALIQNPNWAKEAFAE